jgi:hypothetical protein
MESVMARQAAAPAGAAAAEEARPLVIRRRAGAGS